MTDGEEYIVARRTGSVAIYHLTSSRSIKAFLVVLMSTTAVLLLAAGREVPDVVSGTLFVIIGYYFGKEDQDRINDNGKA